MGFLTVDEVVAEVQSGLGNHSLTQLAISTATDADQDGLDRTYRFLNMTMLEIAQLRMPNGTLYRHRELEETTTQRLGGTLDDGTWPTRAYSPASGIPGAPWVTAILTPTLGVNAVRVYDTDDFTNGWRLTPVWDREEFERRTRKPGTPTHYGVFTPLAADWPGGAAPAFTFPESGALLLSAPPSMDYDGWTLEVRRYRQPRLIGTGYAPLTTTSTFDYAAVWDEVVILGALARAFKALNLNQLGDAATKDFGRLAMEIARRHQVDADDLDFGPTILMPDYMAR